MMAVVTGRQPGLSLFIVLLIGLGVQSTSGAQETRALRQPRASSECTPYNEGGSICNSILGAANVSTSFRNISEIDNGVLLQLQLFLQVAPSLGERCRQLAVAIACLFSHRACGNNVWCSTVNGTALEAMVNESCTCTEPFCDTVLSGLVSTVRSIDGVVYFQHGQENSFTPCSSVSLDNIVVPLIPPPVIPGDSECAAYNEEGTVCNSIIGATNVSISILNISLLDTGIAAQVSSLSVVFPTLNTRCQQLLLAINCLSFTPCGGQIWCSSVNATQLEAMLNESCTCTENEVVLTQCATLLSNAVTVLRSLALQNRFYRTDQAPPQFTCSNFNIDNIEIPTPGPLTTPPLPGIPCEPYSGSLCGPVLGGRNVRTASYNVTETSVQTTLDQAKLLSGGNITSECEKALLDILCPVTYLACTNNVWCSSSSPSQLATAFDNACACPESVSPQCQEGKRVVTAQSQLLTTFGLLYQTSEVPSTRQCQVLTSGSEGTDGPDGSGALSTSQTHFYTLFTAAVLIIVGMMV